MPTTRLVQRQVHLDFHTSPLIPEVGSDFDADAFGDTLAHAGVQSVTLFAKCHHGCSYYPTAVGTTHPHLERDLLGEQIAACHGRGIRTPVYISVVWDELAASRHADWLQVDRTGRLVGRGPLEASGWRYLCMNSPYVEYVLAQTEEVCRRYPVDGVFFDIVFQAPPGCACNYCLASLEEQGLDLESDEDLRAQSRRIARSFMRRASSAVRGIRQDATIFYNGRIAVEAGQEEGIRPELGDMTHLEIESVASGPWGYNHFPTTVRYLQTLDTPLLGMTTAFHKAWADFGTIKNEVALRYEVERMAACGAAVSVGDQLHPRGQLSGPTYRRIGSVFAELERIEPWVRDARPLADVGVLLPSGEGAQESEEGAMRALLETFFQFQLLDEAADLAPYRVLVAPDSVELDDAWAERVRAYLDGGGAMLLTGSSGLGPGGGGWSLDIGVEDHGPSAFAPEYLRWVEEGDPPVPPLDHVLYEQGRAVTPLEGTAVLARVVHPYFNRTRGRFSSHAQTPPQPGASPYAAVTAAPGGRLIYCAHPLFRMYRKHGYAPHREVVATCLRRLLPEPILRFDGSTTAEVAVSRQEGRTVCHVLHYLPQRRAESLDVVEDVIPLHDRTLALRFERRPHRVYLAPQRWDLPVRWHEPYATVSLPAITGHQLVVFEDGSPKMDVKVP